MNQFFQRMKLALARFMQGRHGPDHLSTFTLFTGLAFSLIGSFTGIGILPFIGFVLYGLTLFRMFSRNNEARIRENQKYLTLISDWKTRITQFVRRLKNRKNYKYFHCPQCKVLLRLSRGCGEKEITCVRCGHQFKQKA